jgi:chemotaxis protein CheX
VTMRHLKPFVEGVQELVSSMLQCSCDVADPSDETNADFTGVICLEGATKGQVALSFSRATATRMVAQLLSMDEVEVDDDILGDGVGELANIVAGMAKGRFSDNIDHFTLSLPSVVVSEDHRLSLFTADGVIHRRVVTNLGDFSLRVWFPSERPLP